MLARVIMGACSQAEFPTSLISIGHPMAMRATTAVALNEIGELSKSPSRWTWSAYFTDAMAWVHTCQNTTWTCWTSLDISVYEVVGMAYVAWLMQEQIRVLYYTDTKLRAEIIFLQALRQRSEVQRQRSICSTFLQQVAQWHSKRKQLNQVMLFIYKWFDHVVYFLICYSKKCQDYAPCICNAVGKIVLQIWNRKIPRKLHFYIPAIGRHAATCRAIDHLGGFGALAYKTCMCVQASVTNK